MLEVILSVVAGYFALWIYAFLLVIKFQKSLYKSFPDEANQILGTMKVFGINAKAGFFFFGGKKLKSYRDGTRTPRP